MLLLKSLRKQCGHPAQGRTGTVVVEELEQGSHLAVSGAAVGDQGKAVVGRGKAVVSEGKSVNGRGKAVNGREKAVGGQRAGTRPSPPRPSRLEPGGRKAKVAP